MNRLRLIFILSQLAFWITSSLNAQVLSNITELTMQASRFGVTKNGSVVAVNVRAVSATTDLDDLLSITYVVNPSTLALTPTKADIYPDIGVLDVEGPYFAKKVPQTPKITIPGLGVLNAAQGVNLTSDGLSAMTFQVSPPLGMTFVFGPPTDDMWLILEGSKNSRVQKLIKAGSAVSLFGLAFFEAETISLTLVPVNNASVTFTFGFNVENAFDSVAAPLSTNFNVTLPSYSRGYIPLSISGLEQELVTVQRTSGFSGMNLFLVRSDSTRIETVVGVTSGNAFAFQLPASDTYYLFVVQPNPGTSTITGGFTITKTTQASFSAWQKRYPLKPSEQGFAMDPDMDGRENLIEYVLGGDPLNSSDSGNALAVVPSGGGMEFRVEIPKYVTGKSITVNQGTSLDALINTPLNVRQKVSTDEFYFGAPLSARHFFQLQVSEP